MRKTGLLITTTATAFFLWLLIISRFPITIAQWTEFLEEAEGIELTGLLILLAALVLALIMIVTAFFKRRTFYIAGFAAAFGILFGEILVNSYYQDINEYLFIFTTIAMGFGSLVLMASQLKGNKRKIQTYVVAYSFLLVPLVLMSIFTFYPLFKGVTLSFANYNMITGDTEWVGLENYKNLFNDKYFLRAVANTFKYLIVVIPIQFFSLSLAVLVNSKLPGIKLFRTMFYIPVITGAVIVSLTWKWIYAEDGLLNYIFQTLNIIDDPILWLTDKRFALWAAMFVTLWRGLGYYMIIYLAGLQNIPSELYEAADIDGATGGKKFFKITFPLMQPTILLCSVLSTMAAFKVFEEIFLLTQGGSNTNTMVYEIYDRAFVRYNFGESAAMAIILSTMVAIFTIINFRFFGAGKKTKVNKKRVIENEIKPQKNI